MVKISWLAFLWGKNAERMRPAIGGLSSREAAFENSRHEFMFDSLIDDPSERYQRQEKLNWLTPGSNH